MITTGFIVPSLQALDRAYRVSSSPDDAEMFAKLAVIELCGWIEESMDQIVLRSAKRHLKLPENLKLCESEFVGKTYGFDYNKNFRMMLIKTIGLIEVERIETSVNQAKHGAFKAALDSLKKVRNTLAHTHLKGATRTLDAPSMAMQHLNNVHQGLVEIDRMMRSRGW